MLWRVHQLSFSPDAILLVSYGENVGAWRSTKDALTGILDFWVLVTLSLALAVPTQAQEIVKISTRPGITQAYILSGPPEKTHAIAVLFRGSHGLMRPRIENGKVRFSMEGFLARSHEEFVNRGVRVALLDAPSDYQSVGMSVEFRQSGEHFTDVSAVIADLKRRFPELPLFLVGTSRGTVSVVSVATRLKNQISGVVLTATFFRLSGTRSVTRRLRRAELEFDRIQSPLLFVHHVSDPCPRAPYEDTARISEKYPLISVSGGMDTSPNECQHLGPHGFYGKESETIEQIVNWMLKKPFKKEID